MKTLTPLKALVLFAAFFALVMIADMFSSGSFGHPGFERVGPDPDGVVRINVGDLEKEQVRFYRFLNHANQEVKFLVGRDESGVIQVGFDAGESHFKLRRGFSYQNGWIIDNKCSTTTHLSDVNRGGSGCKPVPVRHQLVGDQLLIREPDMLEGWRYFR